ncbi:MAG TPA: YkgJ family cysteine cluster protein [Caldithrix abyssi]|uniref:YkgJ family cysteine cluster protein n=1 Tax=Caldithrix abyssi TaxID=187145 RepID=A0A7V1LNS5_CALAY|nr:YkgJ family cysteine cluster protein [Caldithrix abyssi]
MCKTDNSKIPAGRFGRWLKEIIKAVGSGGSVDVPCGECRACCTSSYFIHIRPDETETRAHIPRALLFPAPGLPRGHHVMGYNDKGHCPMFIDNACSIYPFRPLTCRIYDCRLFPATAVWEIENPKIKAQARRWRFELTTDEERKQWEALQKAAAFLNEQSACFPEAYLPARASRRAILALRIHEIFLKYDDDRDIRDHRREIAGEIMTLLSEHKTD